MMISKEDDLQLIIYAFDTGNELSVELAKRLKNRIDKDLFINNRDNDRLAFYRHLKVIKNYSLKGRIKFVLTIIKRLFIDKKV